MTRPHTHYNIHSTYVRPLPSPPLSSSSSYEQQSSLRVQEQEDRENYSDSTSPNCCYNTFNINPPFDSAMALTVLVLLTALFFMGFFSIYIRRFADDSNIDPSRFRRRRRSEADAGGCVPKRKGVDPAVVGSLPVYIYSGGDVEQGIGIGIGIGIRIKAGKGKGCDEVECPICLSEFEERESVKVIPYCGHVFHVECIDTWLGTHVTCPLCRTEELFGEVDETENYKMDDTTGGKEGGLGVDEAGVEDRGGEVDRCEDEAGVEVVEDRGGEVDTCGEEAGIRRSRSCCWYGERVRIDRSLSL